VKKEIIKTNHLVELGELATNYVINPAWIAEREKAFEHLVKIVDERVQYRKAFNAMMQVPDQVESIIENYKVPEERQGELRKQAEIEKDRLFRHAEQRRVLEQRTADDLFFKKLTMPDQYGILTIPEVAESNLSTPEKKYYVGMIENSVKTKKPTTDSIFAIKLLDSVLSGNIKGVRETILADAAKDPNSDNPPRLNLAQSEMLLRAYYNKDKPDHYTNDPWFSLSKSYFRDTLGIKEEEGVEQAVERAIKGGVKPPAKNMEYYFTATEKLMKSIETNNLKGQAIYEKAKEILADTMAGIKGKKEKATNMPGQPPPNNVEGRYDVDGSIWNWTKKRGWYQ
jgi:hypothetical protein